MTSVNPNNTECLEAMMEKMYLVFRNSLTHIYLESWKYKKYATYFFHCNERHFTTKPYVDIRMKI